MSESIPNNTKNTANPYKKDVYEIYVAWRSIPAFIRELQHQEIAENLNLEEPLFAELLAIRNQTEFAEKYGVENSTLTNWNKLIQKKDPLNESRKWASKFTKNILYALYKNALDTGNPASIKLWFEVVHGWSIRENHKKQEYLGVTQFNINLAKTN